MLGVGASRARFFVTLSRGLGLSNAVLPSVQSRQGRETISKCGFGVLRMEPSTCHMLGKQLPFGGTVSLYNLHWPRTHCVNHAGPELAILPLPPKH